jgi:hypothetical protein
MTLRISFDAPDGERVTMTAEQAIALHRCLRRFKEPVWHFNKCGCCVAVHEAGVDTEGYVIGQDGGADWVEL